MSASSSVIGIDLGTSNCALARAGLDSELLEVLPIPQCVRPGGLDALPTLASAAFLPLPDEFGEGDFGLAWREKSDFVVGAFARERGPLAPDRQISSAKSWLCHAQADRRGAILPWNSKAPIQKVSPLEVSARLLRHLRESAGQALEGEAPEKCVLTIPASFDEAARALTLEAAEMAGLGEVMLLEEPQAAFYAWIANNPDTWREQVVPGDLVLVCDVGGGTADFSLIAVADDGGGNLTLERLSVGEHILLGGDNLDLALAHAMKAQADAEGTALDEWQFLALIHAARQAKETLFSQPELEEVPVAVAGRGSSLFASTVNLRLTRDMLRAIALDGFLPLSAPDELPAKAARGGLRQFGLPYASDPVISKHLAAFLARSREAVASHADHAALLGAERLGHESGLLIPTAILFNGGFFKADPLRERVEELLANWNGGQALKTLTGGEPDLAVAMGAASFARQVALGEGLRIKSATTRSYYLGLESGGMAIPGFTPPVQAVCVAPLGLEEGSRVVLEDHEFGLVVGEPAEFRLFCSATRGGDRPGDVVDRAEEMLEETSGIEITLPSEEGFEAGQVVPVVMEVLLSDVGALELRMRHARGDHTWKLEFTTRA
jgi:hypothetical protein